MNHRLAATHEAAILATLGPTGRMISPSKTAHRDDHAEHLTVFNANVCLGTGKVWWGDLDLTTDEPALLELASVTEAVATVLYERDGRFRHQDQPLIAEAVYSAAPSGHSLVDSSLAERRADGRLYVRARPRPRQLHRPARPRLWRFWKVNIECEHARAAAGTQTSRFIRIGHSGRPQETPLLVLGLHTWSREARGGWVEWTWYPSGHRAWAPPISRRLKLRDHRVRPHVSVRIAPGVAHEVRAGIIIGPIDFIWG